MKAGTWKQKLSGSPGRRLLTGFLLVDCSATQFHLRRDGTTLSVQGPRISIINQKKCSFLQITETCINLTKTQPGHHVFILRKICVLQNAKYSVIQRIKYHLRTKVFPILCVSSRLCSSQTSKLSIRENVITRALMIREKSVKNILKFEH